MDLIQLVYVSSLQGEDESHIGAILQSCVARNAKNGITGMLLYSQGSFMQVLEGDATAVRETYDRICADPRHHLITLLVEEPVDERHFAAWSMGYKHLQADDLRAFPQYANIFNFGTNPHAIHAQAGLALEMLTMFSRGLM